MRLSLSRTPAESNTGALHGSQRQAAVALRVSPYDRVSGLLVALLIMVGLTVGVLFLQWLSGRVFLHQEPVAVKFQQLGGGQPDGVLGESMALDIPEPSEVAAETDLEEPQLEDTLALITDAVSTRQAELLDPALTDDTLSGGNRGASLGDGRQPALGFGDAPPGIPPWERWEIVFAEGSTLEEYARQLDFFGVELGFVRDEQVQYATNLAQEKPTTHSGPQQAEQRLPMSWRDGALATADRRLILQAGLDPRSQPIIQFYPEETVTKLATLEANHQGRDASEIRKTVFGVRPSGNGYEFFIISQRLQ